MHATHRQSGDPSDARHGAASVVSMLPKLLAILVAMAVVRNVIGAKRRRHGGSSPMSRRREAIAQFHRDLHADDETPAEDVKA